MKKAIGLSLVAISLLATLSCVGAQQSKRIPRIGYLATDSRAPTRTTFKQGLEELGYFENKTIQIEWRFAENKLSRFPGLATELVDPNLAVIVAGNSLALNALRHATTMTPLIMAMYAGDPVADGVVASLARPGGNITGVIPLAPQLSGKQLELVKETLLKASRIAVMWNPDDAEARSPWEETQLAARALALNILSLDVRFQNELDRAMDTAKRTPSDALLVLRGLKANCRSS